MHKAKAEKEEKKRKKKEKEGKKGKENEEDDITMVKYYISEMLQKCKNE